MDESRLSDLLERGEIVWITPAEGADVTALTEVIEIPGASFSGGPTLLRHRGRLVALEEARVDAWVLRPLADEDQARSFLERRRDEYDRMWDGCGCRIDYES